MRQNALKARPRGRGLPKDAGVSPNDFETKVVLA